MIATYLPAGLLLHDVPPPDPLSTKFHGSKAAPAKWDKRRSNIPRHKTEERNFKPYLGPRRIIYTKQAEFRQEHLNLQARKQLSIPKRAFR